MLTMMVLHEMGDNVVIQALPVPPAIERLGVNVRNYSVQFS